MKQITSLCILLLGLAACTSSDSNSNEKQQLADGNPAFENYKTQFIEELWKVYPGWAAQQGYHRCDSILAIPDKATGEKQLKFIEANLDSLKKVEIATLSDNNKIDYYIIENQLKELKWKQTEEGAYEWNPAGYNICEEFAQILNGKYDSLDTRLHNFHMKMKSIPAYYEAAKQNIKNPTVEHTQLAIDQNTGGAAVFEGELANALKKSHLSDAEKKDIQQLAKEAVETIKDYAAWLKNLDNKTPRSFRLGKELYEKKFEYEIQSGYSVDQIYEKALSHKKELHEKMYVLAERLWDKYIEPGKRPTDSLELIKAVIDRISLKHTTADKFQATIEKHLPELTAFIKQKDLIYIDPSKPLVVRKEPSYMAGVAGASVTSPGPYDKNADTYYNVGGFTGWDKAKIESYLCEYNDYILQILNIHEAIPGHYTQLVYSNLSPSLIKSVFGNNAMIEGWAVYTERMMLENGYGNNEDEMWLMYYKWNLRATCNTILDYSVHTKDMSREAALNLLIKEGFQTKAEAENKWKRVTLSQVQLCCYFTGYTEIYEFREELKKQMGNKFNLKAFHEKFLSYGSAPVKYIKELMLADQNWLKEAHK
ncbi:MAG TPA: DUF885 domain-containing protein [Bacteroidia bacterium]|jgi:uncharacterized protein (DUF885 family)|nr:DUF885 domain-containing protein [Bacteroidia bacterium]